jgi:hypothetical protein
VSNDGLVEVYRAGNSVQAHLIASALEDEGIRAIVLDETPVFLPTTPQILVPGADAARARTLIERFELGDAVK